MTLTQQNGFHEYIMNRLNSGNARYYSVQNFFFLSATHKCIDSNTQGVIMHCLHGHETWSLRVKEEYRLQVSVNMVLRRTPGPNGEEGDTNRSWRILHNGAI
jgi:hypothetical protein